MENIQKCGLIPNDFEHTVKETLTITNKPLTLQAIADRIDKSPDGKECKVVDYKSKYTGAGMERIIFTKSNLQPPLYLEILNKKNNTCVCTSTELAFIEHEVKNPFKSLTLNDFNVMKNKFMALLAFLTELAEQGIFPLYAEDKEYCNFCDFKDICRKNHLPTAKRAKKNNYFKELRKFHYVP